MASLDEQREMWLEVICTMVAEGETLRDIGRTIGLSAGHLIRIVSSSPEAERQYAIARDAAGDVLEAEIMEAGRNVREETAKSDRVRIDTLKWVAARRAPKRYGDRVQTDHTSSDGSMDLRRAGSAVLEALARKHAAE